MVEVKSDESKEDLFIPHEVLMLEAFVPWHIQISLFKILWYVALGNWASTRTCLGMSNGAALDFIYRFGDWGGSGFCTLPAASLSQRTRRTGEVGGGAGVDSALITAQLR